VRLPVLESRHSALAHDLSCAVAGEVRFGRHDRMLYATDASIYQVEPVGVVIPRTIDDVERAVGICAEHGAAILPRGGGTSLAGQAVNAAVVIDFSTWCHRLVELDARRRLVRVEPGMVLDRLNDLVRPSGLMFGPDVATSTHAVLGGMIGNNSAGAHSILFGRTVEHVEALTVLLADGTKVHLARGAASRDERVAGLTRGVAEVVRELAPRIDARFPRTRRRVNGYNLDLVLAALRRSPNGTLDEVNLAELVCGSEGTLAVTVEATLRLVEAPRAKGLAIIAFPGVDEALAEVAAILATKPAAVELVDDVIIDLAAANLEHRRHVDLLPRPGGARAGAVLYIEHFGASADEVNAALAAIESRYGAEVVRTYRDAASMGGAWRLRKAGEPLLHGQAGPRKPITFVEDTAVDVERLPEFVRRFRAIVAAHGTRASYYAHASVGCLHIRPLIDLADDRDLGVMRAIVDEVTDLVVEFGGALSGEHGDGRLRTHLLERFYGPEIVDGFRRIKGIFDPAGRLNPGNIVGAPPMTEHLRARPGGAPLPVTGVRTFFRFEREGGLDHAAEQCNGAGVCRRMTGGTMCPSYRATRDERHATRGRGNALRLAISGQLGAPGSGPAWGDPETLATLDLCLSCKACKRECPSNVDVARMRAEYLAQTYRAAGGAPRAARFLGRVRSMHRLASRFPRLAGVVARSAPARTIIDRAMGLDPRRSLPPFGPSLDRWFRRRRSAAAPDAPAVVLLPDCFTMYSEPEIGRAAVHVLEAFGYRVILPAAGCCGRPHISGGLLPEAIAAARATATALIAAVERDRAIAVVGCEPSCVSAITDDWLDLDLGLDRDAVRGLAERSMLVEELLVRRWEQHPARPSGPRGGSAAAEILVHGHCHQKALWGTGASLALIERLTGRAPVEIDSGCCGMAGAFGFSRTRYDLSMRIAELALLPALRARPGATVAAPGTSCRHQIRDALGRSTLHPIEIAARALGNP
jgi:FAD/FMN-containing dehydrogenase/Fe-S oxidoreductase